MNDPIVLDYRGFNIEARMTSNFLTNFSVRNYYVDGKRFGHLVLAKQHVDELADAIELEATFA